MTTMTSKDYGAVTDLPTLERLVERLGNAGLPIGFDVETGYHGKDFDGRALDHYNDNQFVVGFSLTNDFSWARYVPLAHDNADDNITAPVAEVWEVMRPLLENCHIVSFHKKFEEAAAWKAAHIRLGVHGKVSDPMLAAYVLGRYHNKANRTIVGLKELVREVYGHQMIEIHDLWPDLPKNKYRYIRFNSLRRSPQVDEYACEDAAWMIPLEKDFCREAAAENQFMYTLEHKIADMMVEVERYGVTVDWEALREGYAQGLMFLPEMERHVKDELSKLAGRDLSSMNLNSSQQKQKVLFKEIGFDTTALTKRGMEDTGELESWQTKSASKKSLEGVAKEHYAVRALLDYGETRHLTNRFKKWLTENVDCFDGKVHPTYNQVTVPSGRFSANNPTIQNTPAVPQEWFSMRLDFDPEKDTEELEKFHAEHTNGKEYWYTKWRDYIVAAPGHYLLTFDFSQAELRVLAGASQEPLLLEAFANGEDIHAATASGMLGIPIHELNKETRKRGKTINFALLYGQGPKAMAEQLGISFDEAKQLYQSYFDRFTNVTTWFNQTKNDGHRNGFVTSVFGRKIPIWELLPGNTRAVQSKGDRVIINSGIQGAVADYVKFIMLRARKALVEHGWWGNGVMMTMNQHDALTFEIDNSIDPNEVRELLQDIVVLDNSKFANLHGYPPFIADWELGQNWGSADAWPLSSRAIFDGEHWIVEPEPAVEQLTVDFTEGMPLPGEWTRFISQLKDKPGDSAIVVVTPNGEQPLPFRSYVTASGVDGLKKILRSATLSYS